MNIEMALNQALFEILNVGDLVKVGTGNEIRIMKKNRKSIISENGAKLSYSELHLDGDRKILWHDTAKRIFLEAKNKSR